MRRWICHADWTVYEADAGPIMRSEGEETVPTGKLAPKTGCPKCGSTSQYLPATPENMKLVPVVNKK